MPSSLFVVDSSPAVRRLVEQTSTPEGFEVTGFQDGPAAIAAAKQGSPALIIVDYHLENITFSGFCKEINKLDNLKETFLISLINHADQQMDEHLLRTLGVKAFLKKPFQPEELLNVIKHLKQKQVESVNAPKLKRRAWPPSTDEEAGDPLVAAPQPSLSPAPSLSVTLNASPSLAAKPAAPDIARPNIAPPAAPAARAAEAEPEDPLKGIFDQMLQSMTKQIEKRLAEVLPQVIEEKLASQIRPVVQQEVRAQLGDVLSHERLAAIIHPLLSSDLPAVLEKELAKAEPIIRQTVSDLINTSIKLKLDQLVREQAENGIRQHLSDVIREQASSIDQIIKDEVRAVAKNQAPSISDETVRAATERAVEQAVQHIVPELAEQHITAELKRLTASG
jgi:CheY-like chemotaxis protein